MMSGLHLYLRLPPQPESVSAARHALQGLAPFTSAEVIDRAQLVVSELVTNSFRHGGLCEKDWIDVRLMAMPGFIRGEVADPGEGFDQVELPAPTPGEPGGWGLHIVDLVANRWGVIRAERTRVWFEISGGVVATAP